MVTFLWAVLALRLTLFACPCCSWRLSGTLGNSTTCGLPMAASRLFSPRATPPGSGSTPTTSSDGTETLFKGPWIHAPTLAVFPRTAVPSPRFQTPRLTAASSRPALMKSWKADTSTLSLDATPRNLVPHKPPWSQTAMH
ncbi:hypothetical protein DFP72DRAFT_893863 [Ephemerocybe angulata]|uniref:Secreted protein n=1 Tax=Ephemerocybe angulata TaxID=980116 RepID=A0A8H6I1Q8_9AGAR|nr:hypothetical protein DFP72DRAFT_893863 [Tulosesus angulatus]